MTKLLVRGLLALAAAVLPMQLAAQAYIPVSGGHVTDNKHNPLTGQLVFTVTDTTDTPVTYTPQGGSSTTATIVIPVSKGVVQYVGGFPATIPNPATMSPSNTRYRIQVEGTAGSPIFYTLPYTNITQPFFSYDGYIVAGGITVNGIGPPILPCEQTAMYYDTTDTAPYPYVCSKLLTDQSLVWTQNPSRNPMCQQGNTQAFASPIQGQVFCTSAVFAYATPGFVFAGPLPPSTLPGPIGLVPLSSIAAGPTIEHNGTAVPIQTILNFDDTTPAAPPGYSQVTFQHDGTGKFSAYAAPSGPGIATQVIPPILGQYVVIYPSTGTITNEQNLLFPPSTINSTSGQMNYTCPNTLCAPGATTSAFTGFTLPGYIVPGNVTAVYGFVVSSATAFGPMTPPIVQCTGGVLINQYGWGLQQSTTLLSGVTGSNINTVSCGSGQGGSLFGDKRSQMTISLVGLIVYYTGTAPPVNNSVSIAPPLRFTPVTNTLGFDSSVLGSLYSFTIAGAYGTQIPLAAQVPGRIYQVTDGNSPTDCTTGGGSNILLCRSNGTSYSVFASGGGGGGVLSLNALTGALTITAGTGINVTPSGSNIQISATGGGGLSGSGTTNFMACWTGTAALGNCHADDGVTNAGQFTFTRPVTIADGSGHSGFTVSGTSLPTPVASSAGIFADSSENLEAYENGGSFSRICTVGNGLCSTTSGVTSLNSLAGALNLTAGAGISITPSGSNIAIAATGGSMVYPPAGIPNSTGSAWGSSYSTSGSGTAVILPSGTAAAGKYIDGGTMAWTALPFQSLTTTGTSGPATLVAGVLNIPQYAGGVISLNSLTGALNILAGSGITVTPSGSNITLAATGTGGSATVGSSEVVSFSATPTFSTLYNVSRIVLTGNITSFTLGTPASDGQDKTLCFKQGTGPFSVTGPANVHGGFFSSLATSTPGLWNCQTYAYDATDSIWLSTGPGTTNE